MKLAAVYLLIFGGVALLYSILSYVGKLTKWKELKAVRGGKRYAAGGRDSRWITGLGRRCMSLLSEKSQAKIRHLLIWSGTDNLGRVDRFLGVCLMVFAMAMAAALATCIASFKLEKPALSFVGVTVALMLAGVPFVAIISSRSKRADSIVRETPFLSLCIRRELVRGSTYIEAFQYVEKELVGVLKEEIRIVNDYAKSTKGDLRTALEEFRRRCGHKAVELFCVTVIQGMDTDRAIDGLKELDLQMTGMLKDRVQKQTEKRNMMVFLGTLAAASILILQGGFYGLVKLREQISGLPF
ncbi:hypothetical protein [Effusibacillus lacus]|uniref:Type II secretion system protein GspF domain-containing protein n=1 Tax=Effusibacillus lacus TaxID=1348429 RepID=A0A292YS58_9BACL|nr:hypothetical protein [Effusibacillus lacus]TCS76924.1 hypothetical protein EDD64_101148 [Effusibacillus lacus]GAX91254.1 hypothetical protein EFBL_2920 [Effusibacillus lacus]